MITIKNKIETCYFLPDDSKLAKKQLLESLALPGDLYVSCFAFTLDEVYEIIKKNDSLDFKQSLLLDFTQASNTLTQNKIKDLIKNTKNTSVILTSAGNKSGRKSAFWHWKGLVKFNSDKRKAPLCMDGSTNISESAFYQGNSMRFFNNHAWAEVFVQQHIENKNWAMQNIKANQPTILYENNLLDEFFANLPTGSDHKFLI